MTTDPSLMSLYQEAQASFEAASTGFGGDWPPPGVHDAWFVGVNDRPGQFWDSEAQDRRPCIAINLKFEWTFPNGDIGAFESQTFQLVPGYEKIWPDPKSKPHIKARLNFEQFKAAASKLTGKPAASLNLITAKTDLEAIGAADTRTLTQVEVTKRGDYDNLRIVQILSGGSAVLEG